MKRNYAVTIRLNEFEYGQLMDLLEKFNSNSKRNYAYTVSKVIRVLILWEHERFCEKKNEEIK